MTKFFMVLAILLILTGTLLLAVPREAPGVLTRGAPAQVTVIGKARDMAEAVNAPLSILFGLISLFYSRRTYLAQSKK
jgi:uncharacterized membrane protein